MPSALAEEIRNHGGPWSLGSARFQPDVERDPQSFGVSVALGGAAFWSDIALDSAQRKVGQQAVLPLQRSGYEILRVRSQPFHARRPLRGVIELSAEVRRLEALSRSASTVRMFPMRLPRPPGLPGRAGPLSWAAFDRLRDQHRWRLTWASAGRTGPATLLDAPAWSVGAWCSALDDDGDRRLDLHVQLFQKPGRAATTSRDFARLARSFRANLEPFGYAAMKLRGAARRGFVALALGLHTLAEARVARRSLDKVLFGD
jgi:hypothetical protein